MYLQDEAVGFAYVSQREALPYLNLFKTKLILSRYETPCFAFKKLYKKQRKSNTIFKTYPNRFGRSNSITHFTLSSSNPQTIGAISSRKLMAQKREKEETELKVPETLTLCTLPVANHPAKISGSYEHRSDPKIGGSGDVIVDVRLTFATTQEPRSTAVDDRMKRSGVNRCSGCRKKVGLMGFRCRCGEMFCSEHRYSDRHDCSYDYKAAGRDAIARENPMVRAAKILKV
ncbi:hypothetical protein LXL04_033103 [Taraxacum kok-saghyz]